LNMRIMCTEKEPQRSSQTHKNHVLNSSPKKNNIYIYISYG